MSVISLVSLLILMAAGGFQTLLAVCPPGWLAWQDACYILLPDRMNWWQAKEVCDRPGSSLVVPNSKGEQDFIWREIGEEINGGLWIGCKDADNNGGLSCIGVNGNPIFKNWALGEPNNVNSVCVRISKKSDGQWGDLGCSELKHVACEMRVSHCSYCLQAGADGRFTPQCLLNHGIKNLTAAGVIGCGQACWAEPRCHSFNLWREGDGKKVCQLNNASSIKASAGDLEYVKDCKFFDL